MGKVSLIFRIKRFVQFLLTGIGKIENEHFLFTLTKPMTDVEIYKALAYHGWTPNYLGFVYRNQIYQARRLMHGGQHQYHTRFYKDGTVTGHFETAPEHDVSDHLRGVDLRTMTLPEAQRLYDQVRGIERLKKKYGAR